MGVGNFYMIGTIHYQEKLLYFYSFVTAKNNRDFFMDFHISDSLLESLEDLKQKGSLVVSRNWCSFLKGENWKLLETAKVGGEYLFPQFLYKRNDEIFRVYRIKNFLSTPIETEAEDIRIDRDNYYLYKFAMDDLVLEKEADLEKVKVKVDPLIKFL